MHNHDIEARLRSGQTLVTIGIIVMVVAFFGTCAAAASDTSGDPTLRGMELGQSPWLLLALTAGIALIVFGQVRKSNARNEASERERREHTSLELEPDDGGPAAPFRGDAMKDVEVVDPVYAAHEEAIRSHDHRRGTKFLIAGGVIMVATIVLMLMASSSGDAPAHRAVERVFMALGIAFFPFGLGLFFAIKGLLLRSK